MKADYKRYANVGPGGVTCPCCGGPAAMRHCIKKAARHSFARITELLAADELAPAPVLPSFDERRYYSEEEQVAIEQGRYLAWSGKAEYPDDNIGRYYDCTGDDSHYQDSVDPYESENYNKHRDMSIVMSNHGYDVIPSCGILNAWDVEVTNGYHIGSITMNGFEWVVTFGRDAEWRNQHATKYTFDYMESSLEAAFALIQTLHRLDCGSEV